MTLKGFLRAVWQINELFVSFLSFAQVLVYLPLILDIAGPQAFLSLSLALASFYFVLSTMNLIVRNTMFSFLTPTSNILQIICVPSLLLLVLNLYSASPELSLLQRILDGSSGSSFISSENTRSWITSILEQAPKYWSRVLTLASPGFALLEALSSVLVIQAAGQVATFLVEERSESFSFLFLLGSSATYVLCALNLFLAYTSAAKEAINATLIGVSLTTTVFLSVISFSLRKGNIVEASLMLAYNVFNIYLLASDPPVLSSFLQTSQAEPSLPPLIMQSFSALISLASSLFGHGVDFLSAAISALPLPVLLGLSYRVVVIYLAGHVLVAWKRGKQEYDESASLSDQDPGLRIFTIILGYSRFLLIAVYSHLLLLDSIGGQVFWRWLSVFAVAGIWASEIFLGSDVKDEESVVRGLRIKTD